MLRTMLFVPGNNLRMINNARTLKTDAIILDLEDAVPFIDKETARLFIRDSIGTLSAAGNNTFVRVNGISSGFIKDDLKWVVQADLAGLVIPKIESRTDIEEVSSQLKAHFEVEQIKSENFFLIPQIESALGLINAFEIANTPQVWALAFGALDFAFDMGISLSDDQDELLYARSKLALAARAAKVQAIDTPWFNIQDQEGLEQHATAALKLGFHGKLLIHPRQIEIVNRIFAPRSSEVEHALKIVQAYEGAERVGAGAVAFEGKMIDQATYRIAKDVIVKADEIRVLSGS